MKKNLQLVGERIKVNLEKMWDNRTKDIDGMMCVLMLRQSWEAHHLVWITKKVTEKDLDDLSKMQEVKKKTQKKREGKMELLVEATKYAA